jgi:thiamine-phosphate pyrophosphorylase
LLRYYITGRMQLSPDETERRAQLMRCIRRAADAGVDHIQLREKDLPVRELERLASAAKNVLAGSGAKLLINSRADVAIACGLDGVHLTSSPDELPPSEVRTVLERGGVRQAIVAVSCHSEAEVLRAYSHGADFVVFGPVFEKDGERSAGLKGLQRVCAVAKLPVLALGGVTEENAQACIDAGAAGIAGIRLFQKV